VARIEVAPVIASSNVEVCATSVMVEDERLKSPVVLFQEEPAEGAIAVADVPPVSKEEIPGVAVTEVCAAVTG